MTVVVRTPENPSPEFLARAGEGVEHVNDAQVMVTPKPAPAPQPPAPPAPAPAAPNVTVNVPR